MNGLYNKAVYWNTNIDTMVNQAMNKRYMIEPTFHMTQKVHSLHLPNRCYLAVLYGEVVEAEVVNNKVVKVITRITNRYNIHQDICAAVLLTTDELGNNIARVKTIWTNSHNDNHKTIKVENYICENNA